MQTIFQTKINYGLLTALIVISSLVINVGHASAGFFSGSKGEACTAVGANAGGQEKCDSGKLSGSANSLSATINNIINILTIAVGIIAVIMIIVGGFKYITSGGDSNSISAAKNTLIYAVVGLIIVALAQIIVKFVLTRI